MYLYKWMLKMEVSPPSGILEFWAMRKSEVGFSQFTLQATVSMGTSNFSCSASLAVSPSGWPPWGSPGLLPGPARTPSLNFPHLCVQGASGNVGGWGSADTVLEEAPAAYGELVQIQQGQPEAATDPWNLTVIRLCP